MSWLDTLEAIRTKDFSKAPVKEREHAARDVVNLCSYGCAVVAVSPIPFSDAIVMLPIQSAMVITVGHIFGRKLTQANAKELVVELGATAGLGMLARQGIKALFPIVGALLTIPAAFAANWAMGRVAIEYFRQPGLSRERLKQVYAEAKNEAAMLFSKEAFEKFRKGAARAPAPAARAKKPAAKKKAKKRVSPRVSAQPSAANVVEGDFAERVAAHPEVCDAVHGLIHLDIAGKGGGKWTVDLSQRPGSISRGLQGSPRMTVKTSASDFLALVDREKDAQTAVMNGELQLERMDLSVAAELGRLFS
jgi:uncharacterized protein (DUF697 family)